MEQCYRYDWAWSSPLTHEDFHDAVKRSAATVRAPPGTNERLSKARDFLACRCRETLDQFIWNRSLLPFNSEETKLTVVHRIFKRSTTV
jgi:hypothetical protein